MTDVEQHIVRFLGEMVPGLNLPDYQIESLLERIEYVLDEYDEGVSRET